jgi:DNA-binding SARP family transcriptional activator
MTDHREADAGRFLIRAKITMPEVGDDVASRPRLTHRIRELLEHHRSLTVCAAAGSGKSTAVAHAVRDLARPVAWLSLDGYEEAPGRLISYLEAAVQRQLPQAPRVGSEAVRAGILDEEAAGLLAESWAGTGVVLVFDNVERLRPDGRAIDVLAALVRYRPADVGLVLISRRGLPAVILSELDPAEIAEVGQKDLNLDRPEAEGTLARYGDPGADLDQMLALTGGWVTGFLFEGRRTLLARSAKEQNCAQYVAAQLLPRLPVRVRSFLVHTSLLAEVTREQAALLGEADAARMMAALADERVPGEWHDGKTRLVLYPQFRELLQAELERSEDGKTVRRLRRAHADILAAEGRLEDAVNTLLSLGETEAAWHQAALALPGLVARMDFGSAARWLDELDVVNRMPTPEVGTLVLRVSFALEQCGRGNALLERHGLDWLPGPESPYFEEALLLAAWCRWHSGRLPEARSLAERLPPGRARETANNLLALSDGTSPPFPDISSSGSETVDGLLMRIGYFRGRLRELDQLPANDAAGTAPLGLPWVIAGLRATGRLDEAMEMYEVLRGSWEPPWLHAFDAVDLMIDLGRRDEAWAAMTRGRRLIADTGSRVYGVFGHLNEAKLSLRLHKDTEAAHRALAEAEAGGAGEHAFSRELYQLWRGLSYLLQGRDEEARAELEAAQASMLQGDRRLELATVAAYLAEVYWRLGDEEAADAAAELALTEATTRGSQHLLLTALSDVPAVAVRAADASPSRLSRWHELTAVLSDQGPLRVTARAPRLILEEFGDPILTVDGQPVILRLSKSLELLSYLLGARRGVPRSELLAELFDSRNDAAGRSYLRQALYRLREVLPEELMPQQDGDRFHIPKPDLVCGTSQVVLDSLVQADHQDGEIRLRRMIEVLAHAGRGPYLATLTSDWVERRRTEIDERVTSGRIDAARLAFRLSRYREARQLVEQVLRVSPHREQAWQLAISLAHASGSDDGVIALYQRYAAAMRELGVAPSAEVRRLVTQLRR